MQRLRMLDRSAGCRAKGPPGLLHLEQTISRWSSLPTKPSSLNLEVDRADRRCCCAILAGLRSHLQ